MGEAEIDNMFKYHPPKEGQSIKYETIRNEAKKLAYTINSLCPPSRELEEAIKNIEQAVFWANAGIARNS